MIHITVMSAPMLSSVIQKLRYAQPPNVTIRVVDTILEEAVAIAKWIEAAGEVDVFVSGGGNAQFIAGVLKKPLVEISITGFDILHALKATQNIPIVWRLAALILKTLQGTTKNSRYPKCYEDAICL